MFTKYENKFDLETKIIMLQSLVLVMFSFIIASVAGNLMSADPRITFIFTVGLYFILIHFSANKAAKVKRANKIYNEKERQKKIAEAKETGEEVILKFENDFYDGEKTFMVVRHINKDGLERVEMVEM